MLTREQLGQLYERHGYLVHRRCRAILGSESDANDALQETFLRVQRYPPREVQSMLAWLYGIAARVCFDQLAARRRAEPWGARALGRVRELLGATVTPAPELRMTLASELLGLDEVTREMALLHFLDGMTQEEVAARTGYSRKTVGVKLGAAQKRLRAMLEPQAEGGESCPST